jgi:transposase
MTLQRHPVSAIFQHLDLQGDEFALFADDIEANGLRIPILLATDCGVEKIADGWNRYRACLAREVDPRFTRWDGKGSLVEMVFGLNVFRRHLEPGQRAMLAAEAVNLAELEEEARQRMGMAGARVPIPENQKGTTASKLAKIAQVSERSMYRAMKITAKGTAELQDQVRRGETGLKEGCSLADLPPDQQKAAMAKESVKTNRVLAKADARDSYDKWLRTVQKLYRQTKASPHAPEALVQAVERLLAEFVAESEKH